tara:strand:+ start:327 stop:1154 length:828 start_codon:yes stop_codon:yes gene_type:complete
LLNSRITYKIFIFLFIFISCEKDDKIPSYLKVNNVNLNYNQNFGSITENITDVWVYIEDNLQGVYEIPVEFPVLEEGIKNIRLKAGIKANGIASTRIQYPFYSSFLDTINLVKDETIEIFPTFSYNDAFDAIIEDFENSGTTVDSTISSEIDFTIVNEDENKYAFAEIVSPLINFEIATQDLTLPQQGAPVYLELDYKSSTEFLVGMYINYPQDVVKSELVWVTSKQDWNKIYINLTQTVSESIGAQSFKVFFNMRRNDPSSNEEISLDNIKVLY